MGHDLKLIVEMLEKLVSIEKRKGKEKLKLGITAYIAR